MFVLIVPKNTLTKHVNWIVKNAQNHFDRGMQGNRETGEKKRLSFAKFLGSFEEARTTVDVD